MKSCFIVLFFLFVPRLYSQNFTTPVSFINFIEGEWEKIDTPDIYNLNSTRYLRFKFEEIIGDSLNVNVSAKSNTTNVLQNLTFSCLSKAVSISNDSTCYYAFLYLNANNQNLMFRFDSINHNVVSLKMKIPFWSDYSQTYYLKRVAINDTLTIGSSCDSTEINTMLVPFGCGSDSIYTTIDYSTTFIYEKSTLDSTEVGTFIERFSVPNSCDSVVVTTVQLLDSASLALADFLVGEWEWYYTYTGWGSTFANSFDYRSTMNIFENDSVNFLPFSFFIDDTLQFCSSFYLLKNGRLENNISTYYFLFDGFRYQAYIVDDSTIALAELYVYDGPTHYWKKIATTTVDVQTVFTCNIEEVGVDTVYRDLCDSSVLVINTIYHCPNTVSNIDGYSLQVVPNPSNQFISFDTDERVSDILVYNVNGQILNIQYTLGSNTLDISSLDNGLYFIKLFSDSKVYFTKFIKI